MAAPGTGPRRPARRKVLIEPFAHGVRIAVLVQPRASRSEVMGWHGGAVRIRIAAPPVEGAANEALVAFLARRLGVPRSAVVLRRGATGRRKLVEVEGVGPEEAAKALGL